MSVDISSGLLTAYVFLKETAKTKLSPGLMIKYYLHRAWRITPPYMIALMISACLTRYLGDGPLYPEGGFEMNYCTDTWWTNLLYVNNLVNTDKGLVIIQTLSHLLKYLILTLFSSVLVRMNKKLL